ncbi:MAG TPA: prolyl oligopeptidase family serine peptidase [Terriglobales bacterium]
MTRRIICFVFALCVISVAQQPTIAPPPTTPKKPVSEQIQSVQVTDDYRWLENNSDPEVKSWVAAQDKRARSYFQALPEHAETVEWLKALAKSRSAAYYGLRSAGNLLFAMKSQPGKQQALLVTLKSPDEPGSETVVLDPNALDSSGSTAIDYFVPSHDGKFVAVSLAQGGSEAGELHVYEVATGKALPDVLPRSSFPTAGGSAAFTADDTGLYYTRYPHEGERPQQDLLFYQQIYFHKLGAPVDQDNYAVGKDFPRIAEVGLSTSEDGQYVLATVANGDGGQFEHFLLDPGGKWTQLTHFDDKISAIAFGDDKNLYLLSRKDAPRGKMLRLPLSAPDLAKAQVIIPQTQDVIQGFGFAISGVVPSFAATHNYLYVVEVAGGPTQVRIFDYSGKTLGLVPSEPVSDVSETVALSSGELLFYNESYLKPGAWYRYDPQSKKTTETALRRSSPVNFNDIVAEREVATSKDGTKVPLTVLHKKGISLKGLYPTVLTGYGGFGISMTPEFSASLRLWFDANGVYAIANLRGGDEYGEEWHQQGKLTNKQHVFDDFIACAEHLIQRKYTNPKKLGILGGSNGGLLMGAVLTQRPDLFRAVVSIAGLYDMMRFEKTQNGQFNVTEYGSISDPTQFKSLYAYSPYQHVVDDTKYPAILLMVGENDLRVDPWHSRKFAARLQAASASELPIFLISFSNAGHGGIGSGENQQIAMAAYRWTFLFDQLGAMFNSKLP